MANAKKFASLLTKAVRRIAAQEDKLIQIVEDELGYALDKKGGASIRHWRKGNLPAKLDDVEELARQIVERDGFSTRRELEAFLRYADYARPGDLCDELFSPLLATEQQDKIASSTTDSGRDRQERAGRKYRYWAVSLALILLLVATGIVGLWYRRQTITFLEGIAVVHLVRGQVDVQRDKTYISAAPGLVLLEEDVLVSFKQSLAIIYCAQVGLFELEPGPAVVLTCDPETSDNLKLLAQLPPEIETLAAQAIEDAPPDLESLDDVRRATNFEPGQVPILLGPRHLALGPRPTFRWTAVDGAETYMIKVNDWQIVLDAKIVNVSEIAPFASDTVTMLEFVYPHTAPPLEPHTTYLVTLQAQVPGVQKPLEADKALYFELVDDATDAEIATTRAQIEALTVPEDTRTYLLARLYQAHGLWLAAAEQFELLAWRNPDAPPLVPLGELYLRAGLPWLTEANYQRALETALTDKDTYTQAAALTGLGQVAYIVQDDAQAVEYFERALALYGELGASKEIDAVERLLAEISTGE
ncbi:MAG: tetratricopeptide repeat protein [bacterium]|nr:tetratricopeptide repeat protein [bacterium]